MQTTKFRAVEAMTTHDKSLAYERLDFFQIAMV